jgi:hypothetical protein
MHIDIMNVGESLIKHYNGHNSNLRKMLLPTSAAARVEHPQGSPLSNPWLKKRKIPLFQLALS